MRSLGQPQDAVPSGMEGDNQYQKDSAPRSDSPRMGTFGRESDEEPLGARPAVRQMAQPPVLQLSKYVPGKISPGIH